MKVGELEARSAKAFAAKNGVAVHVVPKDFAVLEFLMRYPGEVFSADALCSESGALTVKLLQMQLGPQSSVCERRWMMERTRRIHALKTFARLDID